MANSYGWKAHVIEGEVALLKEALELERRRVDQVLDRRVQS